MLIFALWWCFDDHLAAAMNMPGLGTLPWWVPFLIGCAFSGTVSLNNGKD